MPGKCRAVLRTHMQRRIVMTMKLTRRQAAIGALTLLAGTSVSTVSEAHLGELLGIGEGLEDFWLATDAYIYGYPLVTMEMTRRVITNVAAPEGTRAPMGQFIKLRQYPDAAFRDVTAPNADTLYTTAFFDVGKEPWVLSLPDMKDRYFLLPMLDGWTNVFQVPGKRTTGTGAQTYAITGPGLEGHAAGGRQGVQVADQHRLAARPHLLHRHAGGLCGGPRAPGRVQARAAQRLRQAVHAAGRQGRSVHRHEDRRARAGQPHGRGGVFHAARRADEGQSAGGGRCADAREVRQDRHRAGPGLRREQARGRLRQAHSARSRFDRIMLQFKVNKATSRTSNGWAFTTKTGIYGTDYLMRALVTAIGLGANRPQDAVYPTSQKDGRRAEAYNGANKYVMRFAEGPVAAGARASGR